MSLTTRYFDLVSCSGGWNVVDICSKMEEEEKIQEWRKLMR
jgi:hypothetical protein